MNKEVVVEDASQMEINISNTNSNNQIVLNDLRLLELLYMHPFIFSPTAQCYGNPDYEEWGWQQVVNCFNMSYQDVELSAPFSVEELQWRWEIIRPLCPSLVKASGQIPDDLWYIVSKINRLLTIKTSKANPVRTAAQTLILDQASLVEQLTETQRRRLEVEVMDAILTHERVLRTGRMVTKKTKELVQQQYDEFLKAIRVKELSSIVKIQTTEDFTSSSSSSTTPIIVNNLESNLVISSVVSAGTLMLSPPREPIKTYTSIEKSPLIKIESPERIENGRSPSKTPHGVPPKFKKFFTKKLRVMVKRLDLEEYKPLASIKKNGKPDELP